MRTLNRKLKASLVAVAAVAALAVVVSPAAASPVAAKFNSSSVKITTTGVTVKRNGEDPRTCTPEGGWFTGGTSGQFMMMGTFGSVSFNCSGSTSLELVWLANAWFDSATSRYFVVLENFSNGATMRSPWGGYVQQPASPIEATWVNGAGSTSSTLKFANEEIGYISSSGAKITLDGTLTATTSTGGLLTLSH